MMSLMFFMLIGGIVMLLGYLAKYAMYAMSVISFIEISNLAFSTTLLMIVMYFGYSTKLERLFVQLYFRFGLEPSLLTIKETLVARLMLTVIMIGFFFSIDTLRGGFTHLANLTTMGLTFFTIFGFATKYWFDRLFEVKKNKG